MSTIKDLITIINNSSIIKSTKLDGTLKAIIKNYLNLKGPNSTSIIEYLNILRIIYYLKRLRFYNNKVYITTIGI
jgi:hypothetical protein